MPSLTLTTAVAGPDRGEPCLRVTVPSILAGLGVLARACGGWQYLYRMVGWLRWKDVRTANGRLTHPLYVVSGTRRGTYWLALHWRTEAGRLGGCLVLIAVKVPERGEA